MPKSMLIVRLKTGATENDNGIAHGQRDDYQMLRGYFAEEVDPPGLTVIS